MANLMDNKWTEEEIEILKNNYATSNELLNLLPNRTLGSIQKKAGKLNLNRIDSRNKIFTDQEFLDAVKTSNSHHDASSKLGYKNRHVTSNNSVTRYFSFFKRLKPDISHFNLKSRSIISTYLNTYNISMALETRFNKVYQAAMVRGYAFNLTNEQFNKLSLSECYYCGRTGNTKSTSGSFLFCGIDRVNNELGYSIDNCVTCCKICNIAKNTMKKDEFISWVHQVSDYQRSLTKQPATATMNLVELVGPSTEPNERME